MQESNQSTFTGNELRSGDDSANVSSFGRKVFSLNLCYSILFYFKIWFCLKRAPKMGERNKQQGLFLTGLENFFTLTKTELVCPITLLGIEGNFKCKATTAKVFFMNSIFELETLQTLVEFNLPSKIPFYSTGKFHSPYISQIYSKLLP